MCLVISGLYNTVPYHIVIQNQYDDAIMTSSRSQYRYFPWGQALATTYISNLRHEVKLRYPDSKFHGSNMGPAWVLSAPDGPNVGPMNFAIRVYTPIFSCDQAALWMVFSVCPSVCLSVTIFDYVPIIVSSWNFQELSPRTRVTSMQKVKVKGQGHRGHDPTWPFPDCNSSLNSHMMMKWCI